MKVGRQFWRRHSSTWLPAKTATLNQIKQITNKKITITITILVATFLNLATCQHNKTTCSPDESENSGDFLQTSCFVIFKIKSLGWIAHFTRL